MCRQLESIRLFLSTMRHDMPKVWSRADVFKPTWPRLDSVHLFFGTFIDAVPNPRRGTCGSFSRKSRYIWRCSWWFPSMETPRSGFLPLYAPRWLACSDCIHCVSFPDATSTLGNAKHARSSAYLGLKIEHWLDPFESFRWDCHVWCKTSTLVQSNLQDVRGLLVLVNMFK